jgi:hypothetical protein
MMSVEATGWVGVCLASPGWRRAGKVSHFSTCFSLAAIELPLSSIYAVQLMTLEAPDNDDESDATLDRWFCAGVPKR